MFIHPTIGHTVGNLISISFVLSRVPFTGILGLNPNRSATRGYMSMELNGEIV